MNPALEKTFEVLQSTANEAAVGVLIPALDSPLQEIRDGALRALLVRRSVTGLREVLNRWHTLDRRVKAIVSEYPGKMAQALRDALLTEDQQTCTNACQAVLWVREYHLMPALITAMEAEGNPHSDLAARTLLDLCQLLYEELAAPRDYRNRRDPQLVRQHVITSLEESVTRYSKHRRKEVIEALALLVGRDNPTLNSILLNPHHGSYLAVVDVLSRSQRGGVIRLLLSFLDDPHSPSAAMTVLAHRSDRRFLEHLLRKIGESPSDTARHNLKRIEIIPWARQDAPLLDGLDDAAQHSAVQLVMASGMKRLDAFLLIEHLLRHGKAGGRRAACEALAQFAGADANALALGALNDPDPYVQAHAVRQLRPRGIPGVLPKLIEMIDSPHEPVRDAVRESLSEFNFRRYIGAFDMLDDDARISTGRLVRRLDPQAIPLLLEELHSPVRGRRLRGLNVAAVIGAVPDIEDVLILLLSDEDHVIRTAAAQTLSQGESFVSQVALEKAAVDDRSVAVKQAAQQSLRERGHGFDSATEPLAQQGNP
ncbi:MAG: HEAT repeat domain-containing protein [Planctomycetes bacterium]|nr:HEAT repeat domain-containing protein [Planctomycetota bacterium]